MKILVTGGAGYIGSVLVPRLLKDGHKVAVIDNLMYRQPSLLDCCHNKNFTMICGDARNKDLVSEQMKDTDMIMPLACLTGAPACDNDPFLGRSIIIDALKMIVDLKGEGQRIIYPTTNSGYGIGSDSIYCTEDTPLRPVSLYGKLKVEAEEMLLNAGNSVTLRLATTFGASPRMRLDLLVNDFVYRAVNDRFIVLFQAHFKRNYLHVRDAAKALIHALDNFDIIKDQPYNVGLSDANLSKWELCGAIKKRIPEFYFIEAKVGEDPDKRNYIVSNEKMEKTGFRPDFSLDHGIAELIKGYRIIKQKEFSNA